MDLTTLSIIGAITGLIGAICGIIGLFIAIRANSIGKSANAISKQALTTAEESNSIATKANQLAEDANTISQRALNISSENFDYRFTFNINDEGTAIIKNASPYEALDVTVIINPNTSTETRGFFNRIAPSSDVTLNAQRLFQQHIERARQQPKTSVAYFDSPIYDGLQPVETNVIAIIQFKTPGGRADGSVLEYCLRHRQDNAGNIIRTSNR
jgi:hypothetical protein